MTKAFLLARITATEAAIVAYENALTALASGAQSYTLDTGQSKQVVTALDLKDLNSTVDSLYNRLSTLQARCTGSGTVIGRPAF